MTRFHLNRGGKVKLATLAAVAASFGTVATPAALAFNDSPDVSVGPVTAVVVGRGRRV
jgi:hypothetical protein